jgi:hypothetical protein
MLREKDRSPVVLDISNDARLHATEQIIQQPINLGTLPNKAISTNPHPKLIKDYTLADISKNVTSATEQHTSLKSVDLDTASIFVHSVSGVSFS